MAHGSRRQKSKSSLYLYLMERASFATISALKRSPTIRAAHAAALYQPPLRVEDLTELLIGSVEVRVNCQIAAMANRPWGECNHGKAITANGLARRLKPFGIRTRDVHTGHGREGTSSFKGYASRFIGATALHK
jgi:hypothetical protein